MERVTDDDGPFDDDGVVTVTLPRTHFCITARMRSSSSSRQCMKHHTSDTARVTLHLSGGFEFRFDDVVRALFENGDDDGE